MPQRGEHIERNGRIRANICETAARLVVEDGITNYTQAKRKALRQLGLPDSTPMPTNAEVEASVREWLAVFQDDEQRERLIYLRRQAADLMSLLQDFRPYLTGSVLDGTAGRYAEIDLQLFADSAKEVEIFLLNRSIPYEHETPRNDRTEAVLTVEADEAIANLVIYPSLDERITPKGRDKRPRERIRLAALENLLAADERKAAK